MDLQLLFSKWHFKKKIFVNIKTVWRDFSHCAFSCQSWWGFSRSRGWSDFSFHFCKINFQNTRHFFVVVFLLMYFCLFFFCFYDSLLIYNIWITISLFLFMKISPAVMNFECSMQFKAECCVAFWQKKILLLNTLLALSKFRMKVLWTRQDKVHFP